MKAQTPLETAKAILRKTAYNPHGHRIFNGWGLKFQQQTDYRIANMIKHGENRYVTRVFGRLVWIKIK